MVAGGFAGTQVFTLMAFRGFFGDGQDGLAARLTRETSRAYRPAANLGLDTAVSCWRPRSTPRDFNESIAGGV
jgi:hypothetical protein